jgi:hypothetical protein
MWAKVTRVEPRAPQVKKVRHHGPRRRPLNFLQGNGNSQGIPYWYYEVIDGGHGAGATLQ